MGAVGLSQEVSQPGPSGSWRRSAAEQMGQELMLLLPGLGYWDRKQGERG